MWAEDLIYRGSIPCRSNKRLSFLKTPITVLGLEQPHIHWVQAALSFRDKQRGHKIDH